MRSGLLAGLLVLLFGCSEVVPARDSGEDSIVVDTSIPDAGVAAQQPDVIFGSRLRLWLDGDEPSTIVADGGVKQWKNRVPGNPAVAFFEGPDGIITEPAVANGHGAVRIGARRGVFIVDGYLGGDGALMAVVAAYSNKPDQEATIIQASKNHGQPLAGIFGNRQGKSIVVGTSGSGIAVTATENWNDARFHSFGLRVGADVALRVDGTQIGNPISPNGCSCSVPFLVGGDYPYCWGWDGGCTDASIENVLEGAIAEVIVANTIGTHSSSRS